MTDRPNLDDFNLAVRMLARGVTHDAVVATIESENDAQKLRSMGIDPVDMLKNAADMTVEKMAAVALALNKTLKIEIS